MTRPRLFDLFGGEGGAAKGYASRFDVFGVDNDPRRLRTYPYPARCNDALVDLASLLAGKRLTFVQDPKGACDVYELGLDDFDAIHASPPCTGYTRGTAALPDRLTRYDRLIDAVRDLLVETGLPYVIENVEDAKSELRDPIRLCGTEFGLRAVDTDGTDLHLRRHRLFESNVMLLGAGGCQHPRGVQWAGAYGGARRDKVEARTVRRGGYVPASLDVLRRLLGTPWMTEQGCFLSIPPAYTDHIGRQLLDHVEECAA